LALVKWRSEENVSNEPATSVVAWRISEMPIGKEASDNLPRSLIWRHRDQRGCHWLSCYSEGNTDCSQALIKATLAAQYFGSIKESTHGIIFLGTPHRGANIASYGETLVTIAKAVGLGSDTGLLRSLRDRSPQLLKLATNFSDIYNNFEIFCFYELLPWRFSSVVSLVKEI
jgi:hypothetical protein